MEFNLTKHSVDALRYAIIKQACIDYHHVCLPPTKPPRRRKKGGAMMTDEEYEDYLYLKEEKRKARKAELLRFFYSEWFAVLYDGLDPKEILDEIERKARKGILLFQRDGE